MSTLTSVDITLASEGSICSFDVTFWPFSLENVIPEDGSSFPLVLVVGLWKSIWF